MMFLSSIWNVTNPFVTARGSVSNQNAAKVPFQYIYICIYNYIVFVCVSECSWWWDVYTDDCDAVTEQFCRRSTHNSDCLHFGISGSSETSRWRTGRGQHSELGWNKVGWWRTDGRMVRRHCSGR